MKRVTFAVAVALAAATACSSTTTSAGQGETAAQGAKIAFLMPDIASTRYELYDAPLFKAKMKELCPTCEVLYQNAGADAAKQQQQANSALAQGVKAIVIDPVDSAAAATIVQSAQAQKVPIIAYDRPIPAAKADYYVSFDNEKIGSLIAQSLVDEVKKKGGDGGLLVVNGSPTDAAAQLIKKGIHSAVDPSGLKLLAEYDTPGWQPNKAQEWVSGQIAQFPGQIAGVVAANDGTAGGSIAAFKAADTPSRRSAAMTPSWPRSSASSTATSTTRSPSRSRSWPRRPRWSRTSSPRARSRRARPRSSTPPRSCSPDRGDQGERGEGTARPRRRAQGRGGVHPRLQGRLRQARDQVDAHPVPERHHQDLRRRRRAHRHRPRRRGR